MSSAAVFHAIRGLPIIKSFPDEILRTIFPVEAQVFIRRAITFYISAGPHGLFGSNHSRNTPGPDSLLFYIQTSLKPRLPFPFRTHTPLSSEPSAATSTFTRKGSTPQARALKTWYLSPFWIIPMQSYRSLSHPADGSLPPAPATGKWSCGMSKEVAQSNISKAIKHPCAPSSTLPMEGSSPLAVSTVL